MQLHGKIAECAKLPPLRLVKPHHNVKTPVAIDQPSGGFAAQGVRDQTVHLVRMNIQPAHRLAPGRDLDHRLTAHGIKFNITARSKAGQQFARGEGDGFEFAKIVSENVQHQIGAGAGHDFTEAQLNRLGKQQGLAGCVLGQRCAHRIDQFVFRHRFSVALTPFVARRQHHIGVGHIGSHRVGGDLRRANATEQVGDLRKLPTQETLRFFLQHQRGFQSHAGAADQLNRYGAFIQLRNKFRSKPVEDHDRPRHQRNRADEQQPAHAQGHREQRRIDRLKHTDQHVVVFSNFPPQQKRAKYRHQGEGQHQSADKA